MPHAKKRLIIREMVLENFKSYAGIQHVGPFHKVSICSDIELSGSCHKLFAACSPSPRWWGLMAAANPMLLMPCCLSSGGGQSR